ncbi:hypothetical protein JCM12298_07810 [Desulfothermus naphthae]
MIRKITVILFAYLFIFFSHQGTPRLIKLNEKQLSEIKATSGISIELNNIELYHEFQEISFHDSDGGTTEFNKISLQDVVIGDGNGWGYYVDTLYPIELDIVKFYRESLVLLDYDYALKIKAPMINSNQITSIENINFCGQDIGRLDLGPKLKNSFEFWLVPPDCITPLTSDAGIYFKLWTFSQNGGLKYFYNNMGDNFQIGNLYIAQSINGTPEYPSSWVPQGKFFVGKEGGADGDFARINITNSNHNVIMDMDFPMSGSIRISNVHAGDFNFGPIAIDSIQVHRMSVRFIP